MTNGKLKLIHYYQRSEWELFDLEKDPNELKSEYDNPEYKDKVEDLKAELANLRQRYQVPEDKGGKPPKKRPRKNAKP